MKKITLKNTKKKQEVKKEEKELSFLEEIKEKRQPNVKHYRQKDGSIVAKVFNEPVHYFNKGENKYRQIDNGLVESEDKQSYKNKYNDFEVTLKKQPQEEIYKISKDDTEISLSFVDKKNTVLELQNDESKPLESKVVYKNAFNDADVEVILQGQKVKSNVVLNKKGLTNKYTFVLKVTNLDLKLNEENQTVEFYNQKSKELRYIMKTPMMYDAGGQTSEDITYELEKQDNDYLLTVVGDNEWLEDKTRVYPVTLDPEILTVSGTTKIKSYYSYGNTVVESPNYTYFGYGIDPQGSSTEIKELRAYYVFNNIGGLGRNVQIESATLTIEGKNISTLLSCTLYELKTAVNAGSVLPELHTTSLKENISMYHSNYLIDVTEIIKKKAAGVNVGGIALVAEGEPYSTHTVTELYGANNFTNLTIRYYEQEKVSNEYTAKMYSLNNKTKVGVNLVKNHKELEFEDVSIGGLTLTHLYSDRIYDSECEKDVLDNEITPKFNMGLSFKTNLNAYLINKNRSQGSSDDSEVMLVDAKGNKTYFTKKYFYVENGNKKFVHKIHVEVDLANQKYYIDSNEKRHDIEEAYFDKYGKIVVVDKARAELLDKLGQKRNLVRYIIKNNEKIVLEIDEQTQKFDYEVAYLEGNEGYYVDTDFITINENGDEVFNQNGFNLLQTKTETIKKSIYLKNGEEYIKSNTLEYDHYGNVIGKPYYVKIYKEYGSETSYLPFETLSEEMYYLDSDIQQLFQKQTELENKLSEYEDYGGFTLNQINKECTALEEENTKLQNDYNRSNIDYQKQQLQKQYDTMIKETEEFLGKDLISDLLEKNGINDSAQEMLEEYSTKYDYLKEQLRLNDINKKITENQIKMANLQSLKTETDQKTLNNQLTILEGNIEEIKQKISEYQYRLNELVLEQKALSVDYLIDGNTTIGFDYYGKMVQIINNKKEVNIIYDGDYITRVENKDKEGLLEFTYEEGILKEVKDAYGRKITYTYDNQRLIKVEYPDGSFLNISYYTRGLNSISDSYGNNVLISTDDLYYDITQRSTLSLLENNNVVLDTSSEILNQERIFVDTVNKNAKVINYKGEELNYIFDDFGNLVTVYETKSGSDAKLNVTKAATFNFSGEDESFSFIVDEQKTNYLSNGDFTSDLSYWVPYSSSTVGVSAAKTVEGSYSLYMTASETQQRYIHQIKSASQLNANAKAFVFSGWACATSTYVDKNSKSKFELVIQATYTDGTIDTNSTMFDWKNQEWQLCCVPIILDESKTLSQIKVKADYSYNINSVYFDNFRLVEAEGEYTKYNEDKTINYTTDFKETKTIYEEYENENPTVIKTINLVTNEEKVTNNIYDLEDRLLKTETDGIITEYQYSYDEETKKETSIQMTYHKDDPTTKYVKHQVVDDYGNVISEGDGKEDNHLSTTYDYIDNINSFVNFVKTGNNKTYYGYHQTNDRLISKSNTVDEQEATVIYNYTGDKLTEVKNNEGLTINYSYDKRGNVKKVTVNGVDLATYDYEVTKITNETFPTNKVSSTTKTTTFADGKTLKVTEDEESKIVTFNNGSSIRYGYDKYDRLTSISDSGAQKSKSFTYTEDGDLSTFSSSSGISETYQYDDNKNVSSITQTLDETDFTYTHEYDTNKIHELSKLTLPNNIEVTNTKDLLKRVNSKTYSLDDTPLIKQTYGYKKVDNKATNLIAKVDYAISNKTKDSYQYKYDDRGNITKIIENGFVVNEYFYDELNRLTKEVNHRNKTKKEYFYDTNGNIRNKITYNLTTNEVINQDNYVYSASPLTDVLVSYNGEECTYNSNGTITKYRGQRVIFSNYRLVSCIGTNNFSYDGTGCRIKKNSINYIYDSSNRLVKESSTTNTIYYFYEGEVVNSIRVNGVDYILRRNILNDVTHIYDIEGNLAAYYEYDAWGNHIVYNTDGTENSDTTFIGNINPIRYRGYYYDVETNLYYCKTRYYDSEVGRFISQDDVSYLDPESINGLNLYCYCMNDPVNLYDPSGHAWETVFDIGFAIWSLIDFIKDPTWANAGWLALDVLALAVPFLPGGSKVITKADDIVDAVGFVNKYDEVIVLGQSMEKRVIPYADEIGATFYKGLDNFNDLENSIGTVRASLIGYFDNMGYIAKHTFNGAKFIDKGFDASRTLKGLKGMDLFREVMSRVTIHSEKFLAQLLRKKNVFRFFRHWLF